jgi:hypothetical protein
MYLTPTELSIIFPNLLSFPYHDITLINTLKYLLYDCLKEEVISLEIWIVYQYEEGK